MFARSFWCVRRRVVETSPNQFEGVDFEHCVLYVPQGCVEAYRNAAGWSNFVNIVEMGSTDIRQTATDGRQNGDAYTVSGIRVSHEQLNQGNLQKGIYIINGRKVVVK